MPAHRAWPLLACCLLSPLGIDAAQAKKAPKPEAARQFIERTLVDYPRRLDDDAWVETHYDAAEFALGVTLKYDVKALPEARFSLYVYPRGRVSPATSVAASLEEIRAGVDYYAKEGTYRGVAWGETVGVDITLPDAPAKGAARGEATLARVGPTPAAAPTAASTAAPAEPAAGAPAPPADATPKAKAKTPELDEDPAFLAALAAAAGDRTLHGQRVSVAYTEDGVPERSLGYAFYYHLNAVKVRITGPASRLDQAAFEQSADDAVRRFVGAIDITNVGGCATIYLSPDAFDKDGNAGPIALIEGTTRVQREGCSGEPTPLANASSMARQEIAFPDGTWASE